VNGETSQDGKSRQKLRKLASRVLQEQQGVGLRSGSRAGRIYYRLRLLDMLGIRTNQRLARADSRSFLFVCFGNIMRSAMAEALMRAAIRDDGIGEDQIQVASVGLHATAGREAHPWALKAAAEFGISLVEHRATVLTSEAVAQADCILAMDLQNKAELLALYPDAKDKICMMSAYADGPWKNREIPDPYLTDLDGTRYCASQLQICVKNLIESTLLASSRSGRR
jgi:protein-tyrosine phosphatase